MERRQWTTRIIVGLASLLLLPSTGAGQAASGLTGVVRDTTGGVLPGVTVEAASPALIEKVRVGVTDDQGRYNIIDLRPGVYTVTFSLAGFSTVRREGIELPAAFTATVNGDLRVGSVEETITVSGQAPTVDMQSVLRQNVLSTELMDSLPSLRTPQSFVPFIPGVQGGLGQIGRDTAALSINGGRTGEANVGLDGVADHTLQGAGGGAFTYYINQAMVQEVAVSIGGHSAEQGAAGIFTNLIPKEGGNRFSGMLFYGYGNESLQSDNLTDALRAKGLTAVNSLKKIWDVNPAWGGPIVQDKLWFFNAFRNWGSVNYLAGLYFNATPLAWTYTPDRSRQAVTEVWDKSVNLRLTWQASQRNKIGLFWDHQPHCTCHRNFSATVSPEATQFGLWKPNGFRQASWKYTASSRLYVEASISQTFSNWKTNPQRLGLDQAVAEDTISVTAQQGPVTVYRAATDFGDNINFPITQKASVAYVTGSHSFKTGYSLFGGTRRNISHRGQSISYRVGNSTTGVFNLLTQWATPYEVKNELLDLGIFVQDQWTVRRLTLNLGLRYDYASGSVPAQSLPATRFLPARSFQPVSDIPKWHDLSPRLGGVYDLFGDGKTALKGHPSRYTAGATLGITQALNPIAASVLSTTRTWGDSNGNAFPDCNLLSPDANGECGGMNNRAFGQPNARVTRYDDDVLAGWGKRGYNWEGAASIQREIFNGTSVTFGYLRRWYGNFTVTDNLDWEPADYETYCIAAPSGSGLPGGGGYQVCDLWDIKQDKFGRVNDFVTFAENFGTQREVFDAFDLTLSSRFGSGAQLSGGLNSGRTTLDSCFVVDSPTQRFCKTVTPFIDQFKLLGSYPLPWNFQLSGVIQSVAGPQITANFVAGNALIRPTLNRNLSAGPNANVTVNLIEPGTSYADRATNVDLRLGRRFRLGVARIMGSVELFNVFNSSGILSHQVTYPTNWQRPTNILVGRWMKFGVQVDF